MSNYQTQPLPPPPPLAQRTEPPENRRTKWFYAAGGTILGLIIMAIGTPTQPTTITATSPTVTRTVTQPGPTVTVTEDAPVVPEPEPEPPATDPGVIPFGKTWVWDDGLEVKVSAPQTYRSSSSAVGGDVFKDQVVFTVTVTNKTGIRYEPIFTANVRSGDKEGDQIFDAAKEVIGSPDASVRDGKSVTFKIAYAVADPDDIELQVSPDFTHDEAIFATNP